MPTLSQILNVACVFFVIVIALGAWRYGGGRRSRDGSSKGADYAGLTGDPLGPHGHD